MKIYVSETEINHILNSDYYDPFQILGFHIIEDVGESIALVRTFIPDAEAVWVVDLTKQTEYQMQQVHQAGFYEVAIPQKDFFKYELKATGTNGQTR